MRAENGTAGLSLALSLILIFTTVAVGLPQTIQPSQDVTEMEEVIVTANRVWVLAEQVPANITVITQEDIGKTPASTVAELLQNLPGVSIEFNGGPGSDATATILGSRNRDVAVYQDGVPLNMLANPRTDLSHLSLNNINRIEVYKGAASSAWGSSMGGIINIITKKPNPGKAFSGDVQASYGDFRTWKKSGSVSGTQGPIGYFVSGSHNESAGFIENTDYLQETLYGKLDVSLGDASRLNLAVNYEKGSNSSPLPSLPFWNDNRSKRTYERLLFETRPAENLGFSISGWHQRISADIDDVYSNHIEKYCRYQDKDLGLSFSANHTLPERNQLTIGFDGSWGRYDSSLVGNHEDFDLSNQGYYVNDTLTIDDLSFDAGLRLDESLEFSSELSPSAGAAYRLFNGRAVVRAHFSRGFTSPLPYEVHGPFGNPNLSPERSKYYQLGIEGLPQKWLRIDANFFRATIRHLIDFDIISSRYENISQVRRQGVEGSLKVSLNSCVTIALGGDYTGIKNLETGETISNTPRKRFHFSMSYVNERAEFSAVGRYTDHNSSYPETKDKVFVVDCVARIKLPCRVSSIEPSIFIAAYNLMNTSYIFRNDFPQPNRWFEGGARVMF